MRMFTAGSLGLALSLGAALALDKASVDRKIEDLQPIPAERKIDQIGWATTIAEALGLAREHQRPVFLFTHDGRMERGRC